MNLVICVLVCLISLVFYIRGRSKLSLIVSTLLILGVLYFIYQVLLSMGFKTAIVGAMFAFSGLLVVAFIRLVFNIGNQKFSVYLLTGATLPLIVTLVTLFPLYQSGAFKYTSKSNKEVLSNATVDMSSVLNMENRAKEDITSLLSMHDDISYQKAKYNMSYSQEVGDIYFKNDTWSSYVEFVGKPDVRFRTLGVDITSTDKARYYAIVSLKYTRHSNETGISTYMITVEYQNGILTKFIKRKMGV